MNRTSNVTAALLALALLAALAVGGWQLGWWLKSESVNRNAKIQQDSYGRQNALVEQILDDVAEAQDPNLPASQRAAITDQVCDSAAKLTGSIQLTAGAASFIAANC